MVNENFEMKSGYLSIKSINVKNTNMQEFENYIKSSVIKAPYFFKDAPFFIDVSEIKNLEFEDVYNTYRNAEKIFKKYNVFIIGVKDCKKSHKELFIEKGVLVFIDIHGSSNTTTVKNEEQEKKIEIKEITKEVEKIVYKNNKKPMIYEGVVRGGQQIYAENQDLIIFGHVNTGAEVAAGGNIIIFGTAEGRIMAGVDNEDSFIIAQKFKPSLVSIHGCYLTISEDNKNFGKTVKVNLEGNNITYKEIEL